MVETGSPGVAEFTDPPGIAGDGNPSGGPYYAFGTMSYCSPLNETGSWMDACTLPAQDRAIRTAGIQLFVKYYRQK